MQTFRWQRNRAWPTAHGLTGRTARDGYTMDDMVQAVHGLVEQLGLARFELTGNSMGGNTSWLYTLAHPERVRHLVLIDSAGYPNVGARLVDTDAGPVKRFFYRHGNPTLLVRRGMRRAVADPGSIPDHYVSRSVDFVRRAGSREAHMIHNRVRAIDTQPFARIGEITVPALIVWGDRDELLPIDSAKRFHADLHDSTLRIYEGIGHMPQLEAPARLVADMREFLTKPEPALVPAPPPSPAIAATAPSPTADVPTAPVNAVPDVRSAPPDPPAAR